MDAIAPAAAGAATLNIMFWVTAALLVILNGPGAVQVTPGGALAAAGQLTVTMPMKPSVGVTVIGALRLEPAVMATGFAGPLTV